MKLHEGSVFLLKFADDIVLISPNSNHLRVSLDLLVTFADSNSLQVNISKSFSMVVKGQSRCKLMLKVSIKATALTQVDKFCYLGLPLNKQLNLQKTAA